MSVPSSMRDLVWPTGRADAAVAALDRTMAEVRRHRDDHTGRASSQLASWTGQQRDMFDDDTTRLQVGAGALLGLLAATRQAILDEQELVAAENRRRAERRAAWREEQRRAAARERERARERARSSSSSSGSPCGPSGGRHR